MTFKTHKIKTNYPHITTLPDKPINFDCLNFSICTQNLFNLILRYKKEIKNYTKDIAEDFSADLLCIHQLILIKRKQHPDIEVILINVTNLIGKIITNLLKLKAESNKDFLKQELQADLLHLNNLAILLYEPQAANDKSLGVALILAGFVLGIFLTFLPIWVALSFKFFFSNNINALLHITGLVIGLSICFYGRSTLKAGNERNILYDKIRLFSQTIERFCDAQETSSNNKLNAART